MTMKTKTKNDADQCCAGSTCKTPAKGASTPTEELTFSPRVDIYETDEEVVMEVEVPGVAAEDLDIRFENQDLEIRGKVKSKDDRDNFLRREYRIGNYYRAFSLGESIDTEGIEASLSSGLLRLHLPKHQANKPRKIEVQAA